MQLGKLTVYIDPYLSHSAQELDNFNLQRLVPIPLPPHRITDANWALITHIHTDHCDSHTIPKMVDTSPGIRLLGPFPVLERFRSLGIDESRLVLAEEHWQDLAHGIKVRAVPAAHPNIVRDGAGHLAAVGYLIAYQGRLIYHAGDTALTQEVIDGVTSHGPVHTAFLPVNEHNFFRERQGIIGNMSVREAFGLAEEIGACQVVPVHWDMFAANETLPEEMRAVYRRMRPSFDLRFLSRICG